MGGTATFSCSYDKDLTLTNHSWEYTKDRSDSNHTHLISSVIYVYGWYNFHEVSDGFKQHLEMDDTHEDFRTGGSFHLHLLSADERFEGWHRCTIYFPLLDAHRYSPYTYVRVKGKWI